MQLSTRYKRIVPHVLVFLIALPTMAAWLLALCSLPLERAYAYVDPSVMTYTIQAVAGAAVALSAVAGVVFRRTRKKIYQLFKIDENANKVVEEDVERADSDTQLGRQRIAEARDEARERVATLQEMQNPEGIRHLSYRARFLYSLIMSLFMAFIVFIAPALEIVGSNVDSLVFTLQAIGWIPVVFCLVIALCAAFLMALLQGKRFYVALLVIFCLSVAAYVQSLFMNQGMMPTDGGFIGWYEPYFVSRMIFSGIVWLLIVILPLKFSKSQRHIWLKVTTAVACMIIIVQGVGVASVVMKDNEEALKEAGHPYVTQGGLLSLAQQNNILVFVLDTYDTSLMDQILQEDPDYLADFNGFTYFRNSAGTMIPTTNAVPNMLSAKKPHKDQGMGEYRRHRYENSTFLPDIKKAGYTIGIYTDSHMLDFKNSVEHQLAKDTINIHPVTNAPIDIWETFLVTMQCALYREAPWVAKPLFWYYTSELNNRMIAGGDLDGDMNDILYELDDAELLKVVKKRHLSVDEHKSKGAYRFIHLFGPHFPFSVNEQGEFIGTNRSNQLAQAKGSMQVVKAYLEQLKSLGLYDNATIIVTADHGIWDLMDDPKEFATSPLMLAKPSYSQDDPAANASVVISDSPVSQDDVAPTVIAAIGGDSSAYGETLFAHHKKDRVRYYDALTNHDGEGQKFVEYAIQGDVLDSDSWTPTGVTWQDE